MSNLITECQQFVDAGILNEFKEADAITIDGISARLVEWGPVSLWGQHLGTGNKSVNLRMSGIIAWLKTLTVSGTESANDYEGVRYKFMSSKLFLAALDHWSRILTGETHPRQRLRYEQPGLEPLRSVNSTWRKQWTRHVHDKTSPLPMSRHH